MGLTLLLLSQPVEIQPRSVLSSHLRSSAKRNPGTEWEAWEGACGVAARVAAAVAASADDSTIILPFSTVSIIF